MKIILIAFLLLTSFAPVFAQFLSDGPTGKPYYSSSSSVKGSPFLSESWNNGSITTSKGIVYRNLKLKYNVYENLLVFSINDTPYNFSEPVEAFELFIQKGAENNMMKFTNSNTVSKQLPQGFVQELLAGRLYKFYKKEVADIAAYNSASNKQFEDRVVYYYLKKDLVKAVSFSKKGLEEVLKDKWALVVAYMEQNKLSGKTEAGWMAAISYYDTL